MTQHELIIEYIKLKGSIIPAKLNDKDRAFKGDWIGSQVDKRCRELRGKIQGVWKNPYGCKMLDSKKNGKFEEFYLITNAQNDITAERKDKVDQWLAQWKPIDNSDLIREAKLF